MENPQKDKAPLHAADSLMRTVPATEEQVMEAPHPVEDEDAEGAEPTTDNELDPTPVE